MDGLGSGSCDKSEIALEPVSEKELGDGKWESEGGEGMGRAR